MNAANDTVGDRVDALDDYEFDTWADTAAAMLREHHHAYVRLEPGDGTSYRIAVVQPMEPEMILQDTVWVEGFVPIDRYFVATQFGPLYEMNKMGGYQWGYVADHWLPDMRASQEWTARVLARFLNALCDRLKEG